ncbi:ATP-dependent DNA helicase PIF1 [Holothuria leucospilota]|uniref:ATP-dependent DNA helicase n=1 Tax=Holothuria leucospilota TaxID=206669 RepID=A0A9Q1HLI8_HOLLE|nr:ATP-dependent DNA helicase PIF1 [Holothuria leucospilota]
MVEDNFESEILSEPNCIPDFAPAQSSVSNTFVNLPKLHNVEYSTNTDTDNTSYQSLNDQQRKLFRYISSWCYKKTQDENTPPFYIFLSGGAGTGKSLLTKCIKTEVEKIFQTTSPSPDCLSVLVLAFTGTAAFNIHGQTIHSALSIRNFRMPYIPLTQDTLNTLTIKYERLISSIIDEISMVNVEMLSYISCRLQQIKGRSSQPFGNVFILAVGDFYRLPPIIGKPLFDIDPGALVNLWSLFKKWELQQIMRQKNDHQFAQLLNRIRTLQKGHNIQESDQKMLLDRLTHKVLNYPQDAMHIYSRNSDVDTHNTYMLNRYCHNIKVIHALDVYYDKQGQQRKLKQPLQFAKHCNLPVKIEIAVGARIMLTKNLDVSDGLVAFYVRRNGHEETK